MRRAPALPAVLLLLAAGCGTVRHQVPEVHERQVRLDVPPPEGSVPDLEVVFVRGLVVVEPGARLSGSIEATVTAATEVEVERFAAAVRPRVAVDPATGRLVLSLSLPGGASLAAVSATFRLQVPATTSLTLRTDSGDVSCREYGGSLSAETKSGDLDVTLGGGSAVLRNAQGRIRLRGAYTFASLHNETGRTELLLPGGIAPLVDVQQGAGPLHLTLRELQRLQCAAVGEVREWELDPAVSAEWTETRPMDGEDLQVGTLGDPLGFAAGDLQVRAAGTVRVSLVSLPGQQVPSPATAAQSSAR